MITLVLVRHAKSDWSDPNLADHDRPLSTRGRQDAPKMAARLANNVPGVERILTSSATRARTTAAEFARALKLQDTVNFVVDEELFASSATTIMRKAAASGAKSVMVVAHDPGLTYLAEQLSGGEITGMPTCAVASFTWETDDWENVERDEVASWTYETPRTVLV